MGKCVSCCKAPSLSSGNARYAGAPTLPTIQSHDGQGYHVKNSQTKGVPEERSLDIVRPQISPTEKKMFTPYTKLPPIKRQINGESKRLSLISRDFSENKIQALFEQYRDPETDVILAEGIEKFCEDLEVRPEEFIVLVLAWKFNAEAMCRFTREEFVNGCKTLRVDSVKGIQLKFPELLAEVQNKQTFKEFYRWTYKFGLDVDTGQRTLPIDMAVSLWKLIFSQREPPVLARWLNFLQKHQTIRGVPRDTWDMFLNFIEQVGDDLSSYDDTEAWPSLLDDFVEYENDCQNQNVKAD
ncbi:hypothetical protein CHS0354_034300 [Potamilus streckersoni]|uniref:Defective in cullin neddylation protein n=1 Tax=Potamilus streckersoni TaxID=2493646 RepID=A0AAE0TC27_9BIVA|nr:hypothetical protein CHS0354_034300 [Potamilus streckersoni]